MTFLPRNDVLTANPPVGVDEALSVNGSNWLWAVTALYLAAFIGLLCFCFASPESQRVFHYTFTVALLVGGVTYFAQAADLGWSTVHHVDNDNNNGVVARQLFYPKYINWAVSFPAVALALGLLSGVSWTTILCNVALTWIWVVAYLAAAYTTTSYKWGFFAFGTLCWLVLAMSTLNESREEAARRGIARDYILLSAWSNVLWVVYPIAFGLSDGANVIGVTAGFVFFGILDILMVPVLSFSFAILGRNWDWARLDLDFSEYRGPGHARALVDKPSPPGPQEGLGSQT
ncbi:family A G protein-coupled receptor-like protein [Achaetomium macrosporum]|uniref:Family A G protein-coupled receptor-like protein n=1 Tax=Achaetomium macrosporum TaxID=79813 RepID=A0AAN7C0A0_9PEZI|nr:family A G protein-coupled receptor-like protein [Achaetomium macrosporum]